MAYHFGIRSKINILTPPPKRRLAGALLTLLVFVLLPAIGRAQGWQWLATARSSAQANCTTGLTAIDAQGNVTVAGQFYDTLHVGPTRLIARRAEAGRAHGGDPFLARLDASGNWLWAVRPEASTAVDYWISDMALDTGGNLYVVGGLYSLPGGIAATLTFGSTTISTGAAAYAGFLAKLNPVGQWEWAQGFGQQTGVWGQTPTAAFCWSVALDPAGDVAVTGAFSGGTLDVGFITLASPVPAGSSAFGQRDSFVLKYSAAGQGQWGTVLTGLANEAVWASAFDAAGNLYVKGHGDSPLTQFGSALNVSSPYSQHGFVAQLSAAGQWQWARFFPGPGAGSAGSRTLAVSPAGDVYFSDQLSPDNLPLGASGGVWLDSVWVPLDTAHYQYTAKISATGHWAWATDILANSTNPAHPAQVSGLDALALDGTGGLLGLSATANFSPGDTLWAGTIPLVQTDASAGLLLRLSTQTGQSEMATMLANRTYGAKLAVAATGAAVVVGRFERATALGAFTAAYPLVAVPAALTGNHHLFVAAVDFGRPVLLGFQPAGGAPGQLVTLSGVGLSGVTAVYFNGVQCAAFAQPATGALVVRVPPGATSGPLTVRTNNGMLGTSTTFNVTAPTGFAALSSAKSTADVLQLYPNPATDVVRVFHSVANTLSPVNAAILNALGQSVLTMRLVNGAANLPLGSLKPGMYLVRVGSASRRLVVR